MTWFWFAIGLTAVIAVAIVVVPRLARGGDEAAPGDADRVVLAKLRVRAIATWIPSSIAAIRQMREESFTPEGAAPRDWKTETLAALEPVLASSHVARYQKLLEQDSPEELARTFLVDLAEQLGPQDLC